jgi:hypothetical protein
VRALPGSLSAFSVSHNEYSLYGDFVQACDAGRKSQKWRYPARAVLAINTLCQALGFGVSTLLAWVKWRTNSWTLLFGGPIVIRLLSTIAWHAYVSVTPMQGHDVLRRREEKKSARGMSRVNCYIDCSSIGFDTPFLLLVHGHSLKQRLILATSASTLCAFKRELPRVE